MAPDLDLQRDDMVGGSKGCVEIAVGAPEHRGFGQQARMDVRHERRRLGGRIELRLMLFDVAEHKIGRVFRNVGIDGKHHRHRLADIAHVVARKHPLPVRRERLKTHLAKVDRWQRIEVGDGPDRDDAFERCGLCCLNAADSSKCDRRTHHAHVELIGRIAVGRE